LPGGSPDSRRAFQYPAFYKPTHEEADSNTVKQEVTMSGSINKATLIGHLGKDPEIRCVENSVEE